MLMRAMQLSLQEANEKAAGPPPLPAEFERRLPRFTPRTRSDLQRLSESCQICLEEYQLHVTEVCVLSCSHDFCFSCILNWLKKHGTCPTCRFDVREAFEKTKPKTTTDSRDDETVNRTPTSSNHHPHPSLAPPPPPPLRHNNEPSSFASRRAESLQNLQRFFFFGGQCKAH